jgi:acyl-CoA thioesterase-1
MASTRIKALVAIITILTICTVVIAFCLQTSFESVPDLSRVALIGDSLTQITSYPSDLQALLDSNSTVGNFGASGATVTLSSIEPYLYYNVSLQAIAFQPTTIIIMLGTNDARADVYPGIDRFVDDYKLLINQFQSLASKPQIFLVIPPPIYNNTINISGANFTSVVIPKIEQVANELDLPLIDCYTPLLGHPDYFVDGVHLNDEGSQTIANTIYKYITGKDV